MFRRPAERVRLDFGKGPAHLPAARIGTFLHNVAAVRSSELLREEIGRRIVPQDAPGIEMPIVEAQRRAVPVARDWQSFDARPAIGEARDHPYILYGSSLEHPAGVNLAAAGMRISVLRVRRDVEFPVADKPGVEHQLRFALAVRSRRMQDVGERSGDRIRNGTLCASCDGHRGPPWQLRRTSSSLLTHAVGVRCDGVWDTPPLPLPSPKRCA